MEERERERERERGYNFTEKGKCIEKERHDSTVFVPNNQAPIRYNETLELQ